MAKKITADTTLEKILSQKGADGVLEKYNVPCLSCPMAAQEVSSLTIGQVSETYGLDLKGLLKDLNKEK